MRIIKTFDSRNYELHWKKYKRDSVRAIIFQCDKLAMIRSDKYGEYKFPGGGIEENESHLNTIIRETQEETGLKIVPATLRKYGKTVIIRKGFNIEEIFEQVSFYYTCDIEVGVISKTTLDDGYETEYGYKLFFVSLEEAIQANEKLLNIDKIPWVERDLTVLRELHANSTK
jgi:NTP pyrophosphohydrolases including oxidative damage repair enzymes